MENICWHDDRSDYSKCKADGVKGKMVQKLIAKCKNSNHKLITTTRFDK